MVLKENRTVEEQCPRCTGKVAAFPGDVGASSATLNDPGIRICALCATDEAVRLSCRLAPQPPSEWPVWYCQEDNLTWRDVSDGVLDMEALDAYLSEPKLPGKWPAWPKTV